MVCELDWPGVEGNKTSEDIKCFVTTFDKFSISMRTECTGLVGDSSGFVIFFDDEKPREKTSRNCCRRKLIL
jgi:hypothetical protein